MDSIGWPKVDSLGDRLLDCARRRTLWEALVYMTTDFTIMTLVLVYPDRGIGRLDCHHQPCCMNGIYIWCMIDIKWRYCVLGNWLLCYYSLRYSTTVLEYLLWGIGWLDCHRQLPVLQILWYLLIWLVIIWWRCNVMIINWLMLSG